MLHAPDLPEGSPTANEMIELYSTEAGMHFKPQDWKFAMAFAWFPGAVIGQGIGELFRFARGLIRRS